MKHKHIFGFFDALWRTPPFIFLCVMFLCGAVAGGMTGMAAGEQDDAVHLVALLARAPAHIWSCLLGAVLWIALPVLCALLRPVTLFLSAVMAMRGFVLALTIAVSICQREQLLRSSLATGVPAILSVPALLAACTMVWCLSEGCNRHRFLESCRLPYIICVLLAAASALLRMVLSLFLIKSV